MSDNLTLFLIIPPHLPCRCRHNFEEFKQSDATCFSDNGPPTHNQYLFSLHVLAWEINSEWCQYSFDRLLSHHAAQWTCDRCTARFIDLDRDFCVDTLLTTEMDGPLRQMMVIVRWMGFTVKVLQRHIIDLCVNSLCVFNGSQLFLIDHPLSHLFSWFWMLIVHISIEISSYERSHCSEQRKCVL